MDYNKCTTLGQDVDDGEVTVVGGSKKIYGNCLYFPNEICKPETTPKKKSLLFEKEREKSPQDSHSCFRKQLKKEPLSISILLSHSRPTFCYNHRNSSSKNLRAKSK